MAAHRRLFSSTRRHADRRVLAGRQAAGRDLGSRSGHRHLSRAWMSRLGVPANLCVEEFGELFMSRKSVAIVAWATVFAVLSLTSASATKHARASKPTGA